MTLKISLNFVCISLGFEIYVHVTKCSAWDVFHSCGVWLITGINVHLWWASTGWVMGLVSIPEGYMHINDVCFWCSIEWSIIVISWGRNGVIQCGLGSCSYQTGCKSFWWNRKFSGFNLFILLLLSTYTEVLWLLEVKFSMGVWWFWMLFWECGPIQP